MKRRNPFVLLPLLLLTLPALYNTNSDLSVRLAEARME